MFGFSQKPAEKKLSWTARLKSGLARTREAIGGLFSRGMIDEALYEDLESALLSADCGVDATAQLLAALRSRVRKEGATEAVALKALLKEELLKLVSPLERPFDLSRAKPLVIMVTGVNGAGKTTSIGKLAKYFQAEGTSVLLPRVTRSVPRPASSSRSGASATASPS